MSLTQGREKWACYTGRVKRKGLDMYLHLGGSLRGVAQGLRSEMHPGTERARVWGPLSKRKSGPEVKLSHTSLWCWLENAGEKVEEKRLGGWYRGPIRFSGALVADGTECKIQSVSVPLGDSARRTVTLWPICDYRLAWCASYPGSSWTRWTVTPSISPWPGLYLISSGTFVVETEQHHTVDTHRGRGLNYFKIRWCWLRDVWRARGTPFPARSISLQTQILLSSPC